MRTSDRICMTACSATLMLLHQVTSATVRPRLMAACKSTWSEPIPAVIDSFSLWGLGDSLRRQVCGPKRLRDDDFRVGQLLLEHRIGPILVGGHDQLVAVLLEKLSQPQFAGDAAEQGARLEIDLLRRGQLLAVGVLFQFGNVVSGIRFGIVPSRDRHRARKPPWPWSCPPRVE